MPGPKMGPRPPDFDEDVIRQSPTMIRWGQLEVGAKLRYACREFVKGNGDDEERLMRRIMIARRNNLRDHQTLKRARKIAHKEPDDSSNKAPKLDETGTTTVRRRRPSTLFSDSEVAKEMDVSAVEATRSYQAWLKLPTGEEFVYNQKYIKGRDGHDWLLRKNIWRRMRYRRENKKMVEQMRHSNPLPPAADTRTNVRAASEIVDQALLAPPPETTTPTISVNGAPQSVQTHPSNKQEGWVEAAVAVAESYVKSPYNVVHNPLEATHANTAALDAAARLAAATAASYENPGEDKQAMVV